MKYLLSILFALAVVFSAPAQVRVPGPLTNGGNPYPVISDGSVSNAALSGDVRAQLALAGTGGGGLTNQVSTLFGDTNGLAFANTVGISDLATRNDLVGCVNELKAYGVWSNLVDAVILKARFNPGSNLTLMGRTFYSSNITYGTWGGNFSNSIVRVDGLPDLRTNSMVIVWRYPRTATLGNYGWLAGAVDTNSASGVFLNANEGSFLKFGFRVGANSYSESGSTLSNLVYAPRWFANAPFDYPLGTWGNARYGERMVSTMGFSGTNACYWLEGMPGQLNYYSQVYTQGISFAATTNLNSLIIGASTTNAGTGMDGFFNGQIAAVFVFNKFADTNLVVAANRAARWLEPETVDRVYIGDSLLTGLLAAPRMDLPWVAQQQGVRAQDTCWKGLGISGTYILHIDSALANAYLYDVGLISKITSAEMYIAAGINDDYGAGASPADTWGHLVNVVSAASANGWKPIYMTTYPPWIYTTNTVTSYLYDSLRESNRAALVSLVLSNKSLFSGLIRRDKLVTQQMLCYTNSPQFSLDGLHFMNATNGWRANQFIANSFLGDGDYGIRPMNDIFGNLIVVTNSP
jgi:hypothetical protein